MTTVAQGATVVTPMGWQIERFQDGWLLSKEPHGVLFVRHLLDAQALSQAAAELVQLMTETPEPNPEKEDPSKYECAFCHKPIGADEPAFRFADGMWRHGRCWTFQLHSGTSLFSPRRRSLTDIEGSRFVAGGGPDGVA